MTFPEAVKILGLELSASKADIRTAFRQLAVKHHPDKFQEDWEKEMAEKKFKKLTEAYEFLMGLSPAINVEDRMTRSGYDVDSEKTLSENLDALLKIKPVSEESFHWADVSTTQTKIVKFIVLLAVFYVLAMTVFISWGQISDWFLDLF